MNQLQRNQNKKQFIEISAKSLIWIWIIFSLPAILVYFNKVEVTQYLTFGTIVDDGHCPAAACRHYLARDQWFPFIEDGESITDFYSTSLAEGEFISLNEETNVNCTAARSKSCTNFHSNPLRQ